MFLSCVKLLTPLSKVFAERGLFADFLIHGHFLETSQKHIFCSDWRTYPSIKKVCALLSRDVSSCDKMVQFLLMESHHSINNEISSVFHNHSSTNTVS